MAIADDMFDDSTDEDFRCAVWTANQGFDPIGSATRFDRLVTVEVPQPWPAKIEQLDWLAPLDVPDGTRVQAIVAEVGRTGGEVLLTRWERSGAELTGTDWLVPAGEVPDALAAIVAGGDPEAEGEPAPAELLVCSHGARDRCCGGSGTRLSVEVRAALPEFRVRRTSHLGGHRYAPTALSLPDGRMWAHLDADALAGIVRREMPAPEAREFYRGNAALDPWAQVVEGAVLAEQGWSAVEFEALADAIEVDDDGESASVALAWTANGTTDERSEVVEIAAHYPVLQCGLDPSQAEKTAPEYYID